jgi:ferredoxin
MANGLRSAATASGIEDFYVTFRKTNVTTLVVWGLWWPGMILGVILLGRLWCTVCPMELVSNISRRAARRVGLKGISMPSWVRAGYIVLVSYITLQLLVAGFKIHRVPMYTAYVLAAILGTAVVVGALFREPRAFCAGFCPAALFLDAYGRLARLRIAPRRKSVCDRCKTKECMSEENARRWNARSCASLLQVDEPRFGDGCVECFQCAKACPHNNVGFGLLDGPVKKEMMDRLSTAAALFIFVASGFVAHELFAEVKPMDRVFHTVPLWLSEIVNRPDAFRWFEPLWFLAILPFCLVVLLWILARATRNGIRLREFFIESAYAFIPIVAAGHAAKAIIKMNSWAGYLPEALRSPVGMEKALSITSGELAAHEPIFPVPVIAAVGCALLLLAVSFTIMRWTRTLPRLVRYPCYGAVCVLFALYFPVTVRLLI